MKGQLPPQEQTLKAYGAYMDALQEDEDNYASVLEHIPLYPEKISAHDLALEMSGMKLVSLFRIILFLSEEGSILCDPERGYSRVATIQKKTA